MIRWGIVGVGVAGRARARAIQSDPRAEAVCGHRGDPHAVNLAVSDTVDALINRVDAVAICTPDQHHAPLVAHALMAGRHVLCEFPLASHVGDATKLFALARRQGVVLHVEHIELLGGAARWWRRQNVHAIRGSLSFCSARTGVSPVWGNIARLHRFVDAVGIPEQVRVDVRAPTELQGALQVAGTWFALDFRFAHGLKRQTRLSIVDRRDRHIVQCNRMVMVDEQEVALPKVDGLFAMDQRHATARILDGAAGYVSEARILCVLKLASLLERVPLHTASPFP